MPGLKSTSHCTTQKGTWEGNRSIGGLYEGRRQTRVQGLGFRVQFTYVIQTQGIYYFVCRIVRLERVEPPRDQKGEASKRDPKGEASGYDIEVSSHGIFKSTLDAPTHSNPPLIPPPPHIFKSTLDVLHTHLTRTSSSAAGLIDVARSCRKLITAPDSCEGSPWGQGGVS